MVSLETDIDIYVNVCLRHVLVGCDSVSCPDDLTFYVPHGPWTDCYYGVPKFGRTSVYQGKYRRDTRFKFCSKYERVFCFCFCFVLFCFDLFVWLLLWGCLFCLFAYFSKKKNRYCFLEVWFLERHNMIGWNGLYSINKRTSTRSVELMSDPIIITSNLAASRLYEIWW